MATIGNTFPTLLDVAKRTDPTGKIASIAELLELYLPLLEDMTWVEGNLPTGHRITTRNGLPSATWRRLNQGVDPTKSTTDQFDEVCGMLEAWSKIDLDLLKLNGGDAGYRLSEDKAFLQGMNRQAANALTYASVLSNPEQITGFTPRFNSGPTASPNDPAAKQIVFGDASASGANQTSIWLIGWSPETVFGIYPKGSQAGITSVDWGRQLILDANNKQFAAMVTQWQWKLGLAIRDYRFISRIANIDVTRWKEDYSQGADLAMRMIDAIGLIFNLDVVRPVFYMNRATYQMLNKQLVKRQANWLEWITTQGGKRIPAFFGIPIKFNDSIISTESLVAA